MDCRQELGVDVRPRWLERWNDRDGRAPRPRENLTLVCEIVPSVTNDLVGDPTRLRQVLLNPLGNAIKFTETGGVSLKVQSIHSGLGANSPNRQRAVG